MWIQGDLISTERDYYKVLNVSRSASQTEIKKAYRKLAMKHHPDQADGDAKKAESRFKDINEAYSTLSDPQKRSSYDRFGHSYSQGFGQGVYTTYSNFNGKSKKSRIIEKVTQNQGFDVAEFAMELSVETRNLLKMLEIMIGKGIIQGKVKLGRYIPI